MATKVTIDADIADVNGTPQYRLYGRCTARGSLPDEYLFLTEIVNPDAPDDDELYRVAQVPDMLGDTAYGTDRDAAIRNGLSFWRSSQFANYYDDAEVAANAKQVLKDEVNALVSDYETYSNQFAASSEEVEFPSAETGAVDALKDAYDTAYTDYAAAQATQTAADSALEDAQDTLSETETWLDRKTELQSDMADRTDEMTSAKTLYGTFLGTPPGVASDAAWFIKQVEDFITAYDANGSGDAALDTLRTDLENDKNAFSAQRQTAKTVDVDSTITQGETNHSNMESNVNTYNPYTTADLTTAQNDVTTAQTAKVTADADVTAKYAALEAAYDAAKAVCPDWVPDNPLPPEPA